MGILNLKIWSILFLWYFCILNGVRVCDGNLHNLLVSIIGGVNTLHSNLHNSINFLNMKSKIMKNPNAMRAAFITSSPFRVNNDVYACPNDIFLKQKYRQVLMENRVSLPHSYLREYKKNIMALKMSRKTKDVILSNHCRNALLEGIEKVARSVRVTLGPRGRNFLIERDYGAPIIVNDGVTIARAIELKDRRENAGAKLVQEVASSSDDRAGDGTTSTTILTAEICRRGVKYINEGHNPIPIQKGINKASKLLMDEVLRLSKPVDGFSDLLNVASVATSGNVVMGQVIAKAFEKLGSNAAIVLEEQPGPEDQVLFTEGYTFDRGAASPYLLLGEERTDIVDWKSPKILVCDSRLESVQSVLHILESFLKTKEPLVLIAEDFSVEVLQTLIVNKIRGLLKVIAIKAPSFGDRRKDYLRDIAIATGATLISKDFGITLENVNSSNMLDMLGNAKSIVVKKERTSIITQPDYKSDIDKRIEKLKVDYTESTSKFDKEKLQERIAALSGGIARILIGAASESETKEKRLRYEDALNAVRAALETGYVPGGGVTYLEMCKPTFKKFVLNEIEKSSKEEIANMTIPLSDHYSGVELVEDEVELQKAGASIVLDAMPSISKQIAENAGVDGDKVVQKIIENDTFGFGWNAKTSQFGDMITMGVIDPTKVIISAIEHSTSVAGLVLTTEGMMVEEEKLKDVKENNFDHENNVY